MLKQGCFTNGNEDISLAGLQIRKSKLDVKKKKKKIHTSGNFVAFDNWRKILISRRSSIGVEVGQSYNGGAAGSALEPDKNSSKAI